MEDENGDENLHIEDGNGDLHIKDADDDDCCNTLKMLQHIEDGDEDGDLIDCGTLKMEMEIRTSKMEITTTAATRRRCR